ncbi:ABC transporter substrate-binding protein [Microbacterium azadirachtae]|uniref:Carbohydrate ABC transporter substrate-binding protein, CUT1 family n=1 Tax=Microbacterium azadirachtae TaxID=582680 RepID=A0A1I6HDH0_9MICO|nr:sugar ABC transporter substrate-binding protein [Microbacterium azadirachtae]SFR52390.1 carbohydrate ABC transporter substrate-binding protein, CUT1 family [Microbacterium azadirachtae]
MPRSNPRLLRTLAAVSAGALMLGLAACSGGSHGGGTAADGKATVVWSTWGSADELKRYQDFDKEFMKRHPDITVKLQPVAGYDDYHSKLLAQLTSNTAPDVFYVGDDMVGQFVGSHRLMPLKDLMNGAKSQSKVDDFSPGLFGAAQKDGEIYAAPNDSNPDVFWYDKEALKAAGVTDDPATLAAEGKWTTTAFLDMNKKLHDAGLTGTMFWNYWATQWSWLSSQGVSAPYDKSGKFVANKDADAVKALDQFGSLFQDKTFVVADTLPDGAGADSVFVAHKAGFFVQGRYTIGTVAAAGSKDSYDIAPWPTPDGKAAPTGVATSFLAINKGTKVKDAAFTFWTEFLSAEGQTLRLQGGGNAVPSIKGADKVVLDGYPAHAQTFLDMRDIGFVNYATEARLPGIRAGIGDQFLALYQGKQDAQATLDAVGKLVQDGK